MMKLALPGLIATLLYSGVLTSLHAKSEQIDFIENKGQWTQEARFKAEIPGGALFITDKGFVYNYVLESDLERVHELWHESGKKVDQEVIHYHSYKVNFLEANLKPVYNTTDKRSYYHNYFIGNDRSKWAGGAGLYGKVLQQDIYDGIDLSVYSHGKSLKYDFIVAPGADPAKIRLSFEGVQPRIQDGNLLIRTTVNEVIEKAPYSYQLIHGAKVPVTSSFALQDGILTFAFPEGYNKDFPLVIDPDLIFATYSGATSSNVYSYTTSYDDEGNLYAGGDAWSTGWPVTIGAYQTTYGGGSHEASINKYSSDGTTLIYSTYFGGSGQDYPHAMRVNSNMELVVVGGTQSPNLPVSPGCYDSTFSGGWDMFIAHFNMDGTALIGGTYMGGSGIEPQQFSMTSTADVGTNLSSVTTPMDLDFDAGGNIWVIGNSTSSNFPVTATANQATISGSIDGVLFQLNADCSNLIYSSYLGGSGNDGPTSLLFNHAGNLVISGITSSSNFPTTSGGMITAAPGGTFDGFVAIVNPASGAIMQATYLGTSGTDHAVALQIDCADNIYVLGRTTGNYPVSPGVWTTYANGDVFIDKLLPDLSASIISTRLGNEQTYSRFFPSAFLVDICGRIYVAGFSAQTGLPLTPDAFQTNSASFWFCTLEPNFTDVVYASYFGVSGDHNHIGVNRMDPNGIVYHSICNFTAYPFSSPTAWSPTKQAGGQDMLSFKFTFDAVTIGLDPTSTQGANDTSAHCIRGCKSAYFDFTRRTADTIPLTIHYLIEGSAVNGTDYQFIADSIVIPANDTLATLEIKPLLAPYTGPRDVVIKALSPCGCENGTNNVIRESRVIIYDSLYSEILTLPDTICAHEEISITAAIDTTLNYEWQPAALIPDPYPHGLTIHPSPVGTNVFSITVTQPGAPATCPPHTSPYLITVEQYPQIIMPAKDTIVCINPSDSVNLNVYALPEGVDYIFQWTPGDYLRDDFSPNNKFAAPVGDYPIKVSATSPWAACYGEDSMVIHVVPPFSFSSVSPMDTTIKYGDEIQLNAEGEAIAWLWLPVTYLNEPTLQSPTARPLEDITYQVVGMDQYGCRDTADVRINVEYASNAFIPSAFSPNGDGVNDIFRILNMQFDRLVEFKIFNRVGQIVFETQDIDEGWDGTIDGKPAAMDTYFYLIKVALPGAEYKTYKGDISLIR